MEYPGRAIGTTEKIVVDGKLVPANRDDNLGEEAEAETLGPQPNTSFEELMNKVP